MDGSTHIPDARASAQDTCCAIVVAAGRGKRFGGDRAKQYHDLDGQPLVIFTVARLLDCDDVTALILVVAADQVEPARKMVALRAPQLADVVTVVAGGKERVDSMAAGVAAVPRSFSWLAIHDAARPLVSPTLVANTLVAARAVGAALPALPASDTIKIATTKDDATYPTIDRTIPRKTVHLAQTPQIVNATLMRQAIEAWRDAGKPEVTDDVQLVERLGKPVAVVSGDQANFKVTYRADLERVRQVIAERDAAAAAAQHSQDATASQDRSSQDRAH